MAARTASREPASIRSAIASACARSSLLFRKARWVNSPGSARRAAELHHPRHQRLENQRSTVAVQLEHMLAGVGVRAREEERQAGIDRLLRGIEEARESRPARQRQLAEQHGGDLGYPRTRNAYDPDAASSRRGRRRHDGVGAAHAGVRLPPLRRRLKSRLPQPRTTLPQAAQPFRRWSSRVTHATLMPSVAAVLAPTRRLMFHCCASPRMVFVA